MNILRWASILAFAVLASKASYAADIRLGKSGQGNPLSVIVIEGEIEPGDYLKFVNTFIENRGRNYGVVLYSPGGDFQEALKIGQLVHALKLTTNAPERTSATMYEINNPSNKLCASSCFFIFAAGAQRFGEIVGIHRPYLPKDAYEKLSMDEAGQAHLLVRRMIETYLKEIDVPISYVDRIMAVDSGDVEWLSEEELRKNFYDFAPAYREWMEAKCSRPSEADKLKMLQILDATPAKYKNIPIGDIPYGKADKAFLDKYFGQEDSYYACRNSIQRKEVDRLWAEMFSRKIKKEAELQDSRNGG